MGAVWALDIEVNQDRGDMLPAWMIDGEPSQMLEYPQLCAVFRSFSHEHLERNVPIPVGISSQPHGGAAAVAQLVHDSIPLLAEDVPNMHRVEPARPVSFNVLDIVKGGGLELQ